MMVQKGQSLAKNVLYVCHEVNILIPISLRLQSAVQYSCTVFSQFNIFECIQSNQNIEKDVAVVAVVCYLVSSV